MLRSYFSAILLGLVTLLIGFETAAQPNACNTDRVVVPLDDSGIADWRFLNPRRPYPLVRELGFSARKSVDSCWTPENLKDVEIVFQNRTSDRTFNVEISFDFMPPTSEVFEALDRLSLNVSERRLLSESKDDSSLQLEIETYSELIETQNDDIETTEALLKLRQKEKEILESRAVRDQSRVRLVELEKELKLERAALEASQARRDRDLRHLELLKETLSHSAAADTGAETWLEQIERLKMLRSSIDELETEREKTEVKLFAQRLRPPGEDETQDGIDLLEEKLDRINADLKSGKTSLRRSEAKLLRQALSTLGADERELIETELMLSSSQERLDWLAGRLAQTKRARVVKVSRAHVNLELAMDRCRKAVGAIKGETLPTSDKLEQVEKACFSDQVGTGSGSAPMSVKALVEKESELSWAQDAVGRLRKAFSEFSTLDSYVRRVEKSSEELQKRCKALPSGKLRCTRFLNIGGNSIGQLEKGFASLMAGSGLATFAVSFSGEAEIPNNSTGYFQTGKTVPETENKSTWVFSASTGYLRDPELPGKDEDGIDLNLTPDDPYAGDAKRRLPGSASVKLKQSLGDRAQGSATFAFKSGDLGESDQSNDVKVTDYQINVFGENGLQLRFGKYKFISSIGANPKGEGFEFYYKGLSVGLILERESLTGVSDDADQDARVAFFQVENFGFGRDTEFINRFDIFGLWGEDEKPENESEYWTAGLKAYYAIPKLTTDWSLSGDIEVTLSDRKRGQQAVEMIRDGRGTSWLVSLEATNLIEEHEVSKNAKLGETERVFSLRVGHGDGDDPDTADRDEGYLGQTAGFGPDRLFISKLAPELRDEHGRTFPGLTNKTYFGLSYEDKTFSPLAALWSLFNPMEKLVSRSTKISYHHYRFDEPVFDERQIGSELDLDFSVQAPKGVTFSVGLAWFFVDDAAELFFPDDDPWLLEAKVALDL